MKAKTPPAISEEWEASLQGGGGGGGFAARERARAAAADLGGSGFLPPIVGAGGAHHDAGHAQELENHHAAHMSPLELALQRKKASRKRRGKRSPAPY